ncbi:MAG TPA: HAD-IC family P-type ATPase, partial [Chloroflexota bacterium]|nr:HAD-IC family P-type ATPase [Chloroflexota bacterium]
MALGPDGLPVSLTVGTTVRAGDRIYGGPLLVALQADQPFAPEDRPAPAAATLFDRYTSLLAPLSLACAATAGVLTRSPRDGLAMLALVNPRAALIGAESATTGAAARMVRAGVIVVSTRPERGGRPADVLLIDGPRLLTDGLEAASVLPISDGYDATAAVSLAAAVAAAAGSPWGGALRAAVDLDVRDGSFDGSTATATLDGVRYVLEPVAGDRFVNTAVQRAHGSVLLALRRDGNETPIAIFTLRPRLAAGALGLLRLCRRYGTAVALVARGGRSNSAALAHRVDLPLLDEDLATAIRRRQQEGAVVAVVSDSAQAAEAFATCDLAIGLSSGRSSRFAARADFLAPDLAAVGAILAALSRARSANRDAVGLSVVANIAGAIWGIAGRPGFERASLGVTVAALLAIADGWARLRGGERTQSAMARVVDPQPERWGRRSVEQVLAIFRSAPDGLTSVEAASRHLVIDDSHGRQTLWKTLLAQLSTPITGILLVGAGVSAALGSPLDVLLIATTVAIGAGIGVWQERRADQALASLGQLNVATAQVIRDGRQQPLAADLVVPGDILMLTPGDHVAADARLISAHNLEVDESALTGESMPAPKSPEGLTDESRIVLKGSDVTVGSGRAVVFAVNRATRLGATATALSMDDSEANPLSLRLNAVLNVVLPVAGVGGVLVLASGAVRGRPILPQLAIAASIAIAAVPEGLPLLAGVGQAAVASRLAGQGALVRRLSAVQALGRVDVACIDKTGTLTEGRPALTLVANLTEDTDLHGEVATLSDGALVDVLRAAGLASPHPDSPTASAHPTDIAVLTAADRAGMAQAVRLDRSAEAPFDPIRGFHASVAGGRMHVKGATEALLPRCNRQRQGRLETRLHNRAREQWRARAESLAALGLRVLLVAEGQANQPADDPTELTVLGFVGISDPLRYEVPDAVRRCRAAGIRLVMVTGDHPATALSIAREAGIFDDLPVIRRSGPRSPRAVLTGPELSNLEDDELAARLEGVAVIARVTPLDKVRIVESLQRKGHTVAMTGDGVNDA